MSVSYVAVTWNRQKRIYDGLIGIGVLLVVGGFAAATLLFHPTATVETALIRALGFAGFLLLTLILCIGPAARLDRRFLPLLYNRRHLGVTLGLLGVAHAGFVVFQYHALGNLDPIASLLSSNTDWSRLGNVPFELFGIVALAILVVMAATSHDYWLSALTPPVWKRLHMLVYVAYLALVAHIGLGFLQDERSPVYLAVALGSVALVGGLQVAAALREARLDRPTDQTAWVDVGPADSIVEGRARIALVAGERVAVFRHQNQLSCVSNVCKHQNGPLGEGRIVDGCITCPWHGYQYLPDSGTSPPPFADSIPTFNLAVTDGRVLIDPVPNPAGTRVAPVPVSPGSTGQSEDFYVGYQPKASPAQASFVGRAAGIVLASATVLAVMMAKAQSGFAPSIFEYGTTSVVDGVIRAAPYPVLEVQDSQLAGVRRYLLAAVGKHGAQAAVAPFDGHRVSVSGQLARRDGQALLEIAAITDSSPSAVTRERPIDTGTFDLTGEIVDSKCYLGVMNPGQGKTHLACAARCLSGGLTPLFRVRNQDGRAVVMVLLNDRGQPFPAVERLAGRRVSLRGRVQRQGDLWWVRVQGAINPA